MARRAPAIAALCIAFAAPVPAAADEAVTYQIDTAHTGSQPGDPLAPPLHRLWTRDFGGKVSYAMVAGGRVFVTVGAADPTVANSVGTVYALDEHTGAAVWSRSDIGGAWSDPAYDDGLLFVNDSTDTLRAYRASDGALLWSARPDSGQQALTPPTAANGVVYTTSGADGATLYARRETDGSILWRSTAIQNNGQESAPAVDATHLYVTYPCPNVFAFDRSSGSTAWTWNNVCHGGGGTAPVVHDGTVWARSLGGTADDGYVLSANDGHQVGSFVSATPPAFGDGTVVLAHAQVAHGQDLNSGAQLWSFSGDSAVHLAPVVVGGSVYLGTDTGRLYALDLRRGTIQWSDDVGVPFDSNEAIGPGLPTPGLAVADGVLVASARTRLVAYAGAEPGGPVTPPQQPAGGKPAGACRRPATRSHRLRCRAHLSIRARGGFRAHLVRRGVIYARGRARAGGGLVRAHLVSRRRTPAGSYELRLARRHNRFALSVGVR